MHFESESTMCKYRSVYICKIFYTTLKNVEWYKKLWNQRNSNLTCLYLNKCQQIALWNTKDQEIL